MRCESERGAEETDAIAREPLPVLTGAFRADVALVSSLDIVPRILEACCRQTGMRFAAVARVTDTHWITCASRDAIGFGLGPGDQLPVRTTLCSEVLAADREIVFDDARTHAIYAGHSCPVAYDFRSYVSIPLRLPSGEIFGTLCAIDPAPASVEDVRTLESLRLYADLVSMHIDAARHAEGVVAELAQEREVGALREQLMAVLGHDLRNPLGAIGANAQLIEMLAEDETVREASRAIGHSVERMSELVGNLLDLARQRRGETMVLDVNDAPQLADRLRRVVQELRVAWPERAVEARIDDLARVRCDADRVAQLLSNLVGNALHHGTDERPITVEASVDGRAFHLEVGNAGPPIPDAVRDRLFLPFRRGDVREGKAGAMAGLGLGSYIAHQIAVAHGGTLECRSDERGTRFTFEMPLDAGTGHMTALPPPA